jgi:hypothetical protein
MICWLEFLKIRRKQRTPSSSVPRKKVEAIVHSTSRKPKNWMMHSFGTMTNFHRKATLALLLLVIVPSAWCWSSSTTTTRRQWFLGVASGLATSSAAHAACLPGDLSKDCIGVYKVPIDDNSLRYFGTPEALKKFAPDLNFVPPIPPPKNVAQAWEILNAQRLAADDIQQVVSAGRLEEAGIKILNLVPKVTSSGRFIVQTILNENESSSETASSPKLSAIQELQLSKLQEQFSMVLALWGQCDVEMGQGLRGEMGVSAVAQLQLLESLRDATVAFDDFLASASSSSWAPKKSS